MRCACSIVGPDGLRDGAEHALAIDVFCDLSNRHDVAAVGVLGRNDRGKRMLPSCHRLNDGVDTQLIVGPRALNALSLVRHLETVCPGLPMTAIATHRTARHEPLPVAMPGDRTARPRASMPGTGEVLRCVDVLSVEQARRAAFEAGWDAARFGVAPFGDALREFRNGYAAGLVGSRTRQEADYATRKWLQLRHGAAARRIHFDPAVTPLQLQWLIQMAPYCPITRVPLTQGTGEGSDCSIDRVDNAVGYRLRNLACMSRQANDAKAAMGAAALGQMTARALASDKIVGGLPPEAWQRLWTLQSMHTGAHWQTVDEWPAVLLPLQEINTTLPWGYKLALARFAQGAAERNPALRLLSKRAGTFFRDFASAFWTASEQCAARADRYPQGAPAWQRSHWANEDAWRIPAVQFFWQRFSRQVDPGSARRLYEAFPAHDWRDGSTTVTLPAFRARRGACLTLIDE